MQSSVNNLFNVCNTVMQEWFHNGFNKFKQWQSASTMESSVMKVLIFENCNVRLVSENVFLIPLVNSIRAKIFKRLYKYPENFFIYVRCCLLLADCSHPYEDSRSPWSYNLHA